MILTGIGIINNRVNAPIAPVVQCFTANGTWSCCPGTTCIEVVAVGAGGRGATGGGDMAFNRSSLGGGGGAGGGVSICVLTSGFGTSQSVVVGSGNSCFGALVSATKGGDGVVGLTSVTVGTANACAAGGVGNFANGGFGGNSCAANGTGCGGAGGAGANSPGGGGAGSQSYLQNPPTVWKGGAGGAGGAGATLCGITLGSGGLGGNGDYPGISCVAPQSGNSYGGGGGGGGARAESLGCQTGQPGGPGIIKVTQFFS